MNALRAFGRLIPLSLVIPFVAFNLVSSPQTKRPITSFQSSEISIPNKVELIYSSDPNDSWNRIFQLLFSRTFKANLSSEFPEAEPVITLDAMATPGLRISRRRFERSEVADRAIEPLYPSFFSIEGVQQVLTEPHYSYLKEALNTAIEDRSTRSIPARTLMQMDAWAAFDVLFEYGNVRNDRNQQVLLDLLAQFVHKLALSDEEISRLKTNFRLSDGKLPRLFEPDGGWMEVQLMPTRLHDHAASYRRAARVFLKPTEAPVDKRAFAEDLKLNRHVDRLDAVALIVQNLLIDKTGRVRSSPIINGVQLRTFSKNQTQKSVVSEFELSRKLLLDVPEGTGFFESTNNAPAYLATSGNDYGFATPLIRNNAPVVAQLHTRCSQCHGQSQKILMTFAIHDFIEAPPVLILNPKDNERALYVATEKMKRDDYKSLIARW